MNISDEAVEASYKGFMEIGRGGTIRQAISRALEAAAPHLMAQAWDEGRQADDFSVSTGFEKNPYRSSGAGE
jgi:hypothetical protein